MKKIIQFSLIIALCALALQRYGAAFFASLAGLAFMIFFHELGHFAAARACGVSVRRFSIGFGSVIFARRWGRTIYQLAAVPLGGFVKMKGESSAPASALDSCSAPASALDSCSAPAAAPAAAKARYDGSYAAAPLHKKLIILLAGPGANFLLGWLIFFALALAPVQDAAPVVGESTNAALAAGDEILAINGVAVRGFSQIAAQVRAQNLLQIRRDGRLQTARVAAKQISEPDVLGKMTKRYVMGIRAAKQSVEYRRSIAQAAAAASARTAEMAGLIFRSLRMLLGGEIPVREVGGIIAINDVASTAAQAGVATFAAICALISINLGVMNLLPIPVLDGGHIAILLLGAVFGARVQAALLRYGGYLGLAALGALMLLATFNDISRLLD